jgi:uncharacterized protein (DUF362 family)
MRRREILRGGLAAAAGVGLGAGSAAGAEARARVIVVRAEDRRDGLRRAVTLLGPVEVGGKHVVLKPNLNSADPFPGSTHPDTLAALVDWLGRAGATRLTVADRSGMGVTREVMGATGVFAQGRRLGFGAVALDELPDREWVPHPLPGGDWRRGVLFPRLLEEAEAIVSTCCLKTHRFGGQITLSLKNSVGMVAKHGPDGYNYMTELHRSPAQRRMIAELNQLYRPAAVVLDGLEAFVRGGPEAGTRVAPGVIIAGTDRVAVDAVGVAVLRLYDTTPEVAAGPVFRQAQLARAAEIGLGVGRGDLIDLATDDAAGEAVLARLRPILARG